MNVNYKQVGARIRDRRKLMGYTQEAIAEIVDLSASFVSHIECGRKKASLDTLVRISAALNVTVDWFLGGTNTIGASAFLPEMQKLMVPAGMRAVHLNVPQDGLGEHGKN